MNVLPDEEHPGWPWARRAFALAALATWIPRGWHLPDNYSSAGVLVERSALPLTHWVVYSPPVAWALWGVILLGLALFGVGVWPRVGLGSATVAMWALNFHEGLNFKAYDRLMFWVSLLLLLTPTAMLVRGARGSPATRHALRLVYAGIYGSTGMMKLLMEPTWSNGDVLRYALVDNNFGLRPLGVWVSSVPALCAVLGWGTVAFEVGFPLLIWWARARVPLLLVGVAFHLGTFGMMHVNTFAVVAIAAYPVLLDAGQARRLGALVGQLPRWPWVLALSGAACTAAAPSVAACLHGPNSPSDWHVPDPSVRRQLRADVEALAALPRADDAGRAEAQAWVARRWEAAGARVEIAGDHVATTLGVGPVGWRVIARYDAVVASPSADRATSVAVVDALIDAAATLSGGRGVRVEAWGGAPLVGGEGRPLYLDGLGHTTMGRGSQGHPAPWSWVLTWQGDFLGVVGDGPVRAVARGLRSPVPVMVLPRWPGAGSSWTGSSWTGALDDAPPGAVVLTDTARWRAPLTNRADDTPDHIDFDTLTFVVEAVRALVGADVEER